MTDDMDLTPLVRAWIRDTLPPAAASSHLLEAVDEQVPTIRQQHHPWPPLPHPRRQEVTSGLPTRSGQAPVTPATGLVRPIRSRPLHVMVRFVVVGVIMALFGGFLLAGVLTQPNEEWAPAVGASASATPSPYTTYLPGVDLLTALVEPGVHRTPQRWRPESRLGSLLYARPSRSSCGLPWDVWVFRDEAIQVGATGSHAFQALGDPLFRVAVHYVAGSAWSRPDTSF